MAEDIENERPSTTELEQEYDEETDVDTDEKNPNQDHRDNQVLPRSAGSLPSGVPSLTIGLLGSLPMNGPPPRMIMGSSASSSGPPPLTSLSLPPPPTSVRGLPTPAGIPVPPPSHHLLPHPAMSPSVPRGPPPGLGMRGPPPGMDMNHHIPPPGRPEWANVVQQPAPHVNPAFFPPPGFPPPIGQPPPFITDWPPHANDTPNISETEFEEVMGRNRTVSSSAIARSVADASTGDYASAIETLVTAISLIKQSKVAHDERCKILVSSLQDTLGGGVIIEAKSYGSRRDRSRSRDREKRRRLSRSRDRERPSERDHRDRDRDRERDRERERDYVERPRKSHERDYRQVRNPPNYEERYSSDEDSRRDYSGRGSDRDKERERDGGGGGMRGGRGGDPGMDRESRSMRH